MKPPDFRYLAPRSLDEALEALTNHGEDAKVLAGGQSLVPMMNLRLAAPTALVDLNYLHDLAGVRQTDDDQVVVGAMTRHREVAANADLRRHVPVLAHAASFIGYPAVRNRGTLGGSLAHADPVAEMPCVALMLDAELLIAGPSGQRAVSAAEFFQGYFTTALRPAEILTGVKIHTDGGSERWAFRKFARKTGDFAVAVAAVTASLTGATIERLRVGLAGVSDRPVRAQRLEQSLSGSEVSDVRKAVAEGQAGSMVVAEGQSARWNADRAEVAGVLAERAIAELLESEPGS
jgi:carbon-monoxide dehydrogenase medium subunit